MVMMMVFHIITIYEEKIPHLVNGYSLKFYKNTLYRDEFLYSINKELDFIERLKESNPFNL